MFYIVARRGAEVKALRNGTRQALTELNGPT
jgi:hypothetical protein